MSDIAISPIPAVTQTLRWWSYRLRRTCQRLRRAIEYATGKLSTDSAQQIMFDCRCAAGQYPLLILDTSETLNQARELFTDHPALPHLIEAACSMVASKWEDGDQGYEARRWAIEIVSDYAKRTNIALIPWTEIEAPE